METKPVNTVALFVSLDVLADIQFVLKLYAQGMNALEIQHHLVVDPNATGPAHPMEDTVQQITMEFLRDMQTLKQLTIQKVNVHVVSARISGSNLHFMIGYNEP